MWGVDEERDYDNSYWPGWQSQYRPTHGWHGQRPHQAANTMPPPYGAMRRPPQDLPPEMPDAVRRAPLLQNNFGRRPWLTPEEDLYQDFNDPLRPTSIEVSFKSGAILCEVNWSPPQINRQIPYSFKVDAHGGHTQSMDLPHWKMNMRMKTTPGQWYTVEVRAVAGGRVIGFGKTQFKAVFTDEEMRRLHERAVDYVNDNMHRFEVFYRCKPKAYYDDIRFNRNHIMEKYLKDNNGQAASAINGVLHGLFWSARLAANNTLPQHSPFGNIRMRLPAQSIFDPAIHEIYFSDFYCNYITHYVTVVVCVRGSESDRYCRRCLMRLNPEANPFLQCFRQPWGEFEYWINKKVWVEVYYTENVPLSWGHFDQIIATGAGTSKPGGLPHNKFCTICNLFPLVPPSNYQTEAEAQQRKRALPSDEQDDFGNKRSRQDSEEYDETRFNSTFHLLMALERNRLAAEEATDEPGDADVIETLCSLTDAVVAEIGPVVLVPEHGFVGRPHKVKEPEPVIEKEEKEEETKEEEETGNENEENEPVLKASDKENLETKEGKAVFEQMLAAQEDLDRKCRELQKLLNTLHNSVTTLEKKIQPLRS